MPRTYHVQQNRNGTFSYIIRSGDGAERIDFRREFASEAAPEKRRARRSPSWSVVTPRL